MRRLITLFALVVFFTTTVHASAYPNLFGWWVRCPNPKPDYAERYRCGTFNESLLLDINGHPKNLTGSAITLNLFADTMYEADIDYSGWQTGYVWSGTLAGIQNSYFYVVYTAGVFIVHAASPLGIYEATYDPSPDIGNLYMIVKYY